MNQLRQKFMRRIIKITISLILLMVGSLVLSDRVLAANVTVRVHIRHYSSVEDFSAQPGYSVDEGYYVDLSWKNPTEPVYKGTVIRFRTDNYPLHQYDGEEVYDSSGTYCRHSGLVGGTTYYYAAFAYNEDNLYSLGERVSAITQEVLPEVRAEIKTPKDGKKVKGNSLTVMAEIVEGSVSDVKNILFEYKSTSNTDWLSIPAPNNPDDSAPYFVHWDVSKLAGGSYNLRAKATDIDDVSDPNPPYITVIVIGSSSDITAMAIGSSPDIEEWANREGERYKRVKLLNNKDNTVVIARDKRNSLTEIVIPRGSLATDTMLKIIVNPVSLPHAQRWIRPIGEYLSVELENGQTLLANNKQATLVIPYKDEDNDGKIDGTNIPEKRLIALCHRRGWRTWKRDFGVKVDEVNNIFTITTRHLSIFGLFTPIVVDLSNIIVYPNPFKPHLGHTGIYFKGLTEKTTIKIYNIAGELVRKIENVDGETTWDARNNSGNKVASGVYIYLITNDKGNKRTGKLAVIK